jgi:hypothetical protein
MPGTHVSKYPKGLSKQVMLYSAVCRCFRANKGDYGGKSQTSGWFKQCGYSQRRPLLWRLAVKTAGNEELTQPDKNGLTSQRGNNHYMCHPRATMSQRHHLELHRNREACFCKSHMMASQDIGPIRSRRTSRTYHISRPSKSQRSKPYGYGVHDFILVTTRPR